jgi:hypothetical protein
MRERGQKSGKIPWLLVSIATGVVIVVVMALLYFSGFIPVIDEPSSATLVPVKTVSTTLRQITPAVTVIPSGTTTRTQTTVMTEPTTIAVPLTGVYVRVDYIGSFKGTYGTSGVQQTVRQSGMRWYPLPNAVGTVFASFQKEDGTTKNALTVEIYKDGKLLQSSKSSAAFGKVEITADL